MTGVVTHEDGRAWVRVALMLSDAELKRERALARETRALHRKYLRARRRCAEIEARARDLGVWQVTERAST